MQHLRREMTGILDEAVDATNRFGLDLPVVRRRADIQQALGQWEPSVMFYGLYNAGKSTLLNALLSEDGQEVADTADSPCTDSINSYKLGDFVVFDTPGLDAPEEHEELTKAHLEKVQVVVFVLSTRGSFEERKTIKELARIWESGRPLIIVLNDKGGKDLHSPEIAGKQRKILDLLEAEANDSSVREGVDFLCVNARIGFKAKALTNSPDKMTRKKGDILWEQSGVGDLANMIMARLMGARGSEVLRPAKLMLQKAINDSIVALEEEAGLEQEGAIYRVLKRRLHEIESDFVDTCTVAIQGLRNMLIKDLDAALQADLSVDSFFESYVEQVSKVMARHAEESNRKVEAEFLAMDAEFPGGETPFADAFGVEIDPDIEFDDKGRAQSSSAAYLKKMSPEKRKRVARQMTNFFEGEAGKQVIKEGLLKLRGLKVPYFKGRWEKTLGRWAGKIGKGIGVGIQVFAVCFEVHNAVKGQKAYENFLKKKQRDIRNTARTVAHQTENEVVGEVPRLALDIFGPLKGLVDELIAELKEEDREYEQLQGKLDGLREQLLQISISN